MTASSLPSSSCAWFLLNENWLGSSESSATLSRLKVTALRLALLALSGEHLLLLLWFLPSLEALRIGLDAERLCLFSRLLLLYLDRPSIIFELLTLSNGVRVLCYCWTGCCWESRSSFSFSSCLKSSASCAINSFCLRSSRLIFCNYLFLSESPTTSTFNYSCTFDLSSRAYCSFLTYTYNSV